MKNEGSLQSTFDLFRGFLNHGNYGSAMVSLATLFYCLPNADSRSRKLLQPQIDMIEISDELIQEAMLEIEKRIARIEQIISVGSRWDVDEIFLLLQLRVEVDILSSLLDKTSNTAPPNLSDIDVWFDMISVSTEHKRHFDYAAKTIKKNWKIPIRTKWLDTT